ncbi:MAG: hypothetical protein DMF63_04070 [Acidobacteria bacterium]|nr:MAG: hypothetical protein DMF63_04070 [Acidobacteriota bacterium]
MTNTQFNTGAIKPVECVKEGFELIKKDYWILFAIGLVGGLIGGATMYILAGAMFCGIFFAYLKAVDGKPVTFDDLWKGMNWFGPGLLVVAFIVVPLIGFYIFAYVSMIGAIIGGSQAGEAGLVGAFVVIGIIDLVVLVAMVSFHTLLMFSFPLIVDRNLGAIDAMRTSAKAVWHNLGGVVGLVVVNMGLAFVGYLALCFGLYFVIPIIIAGNVVAYRRVFPSLEMRTNVNPPPPDSYNWS